MRLHEFKVFCILVVTVLSFLFFLQLCTACGPSPYPTCTAAQRDAQRCDGNRITQCNGANWTVVFDCDDTRCAETDGGVTCQSK